ncbi:MAG: matrixin family metalloprotease [Xenococcaceae cyanobacterium]
MNLDRLQTRLDSLDSFELDKFGEKALTTSIQIGQNTFRTKIINRIQNWDKDSLTRGVADLEDAVKLHSSNSLNLVSEAIENYFSDGNNSFVRSKLLRLEKADLSETCSWSGNPTELPRSASTSSIPKHSSAETQVKDFQHSNICGCSACCGHKIDTQSNFSQTEQYFETVSFFSTFGEPWSQPGGKGNPVNITYSYNNLLDGSIQGINNADMKAAIEEAFGLWSSVAPLNFTEVQDSASNSQIRIGQEYIDGGNGTLAYAFAPTNGDIRFDNGENWNLNLFLETAVHEIGHSLGLAHEDSNSAIMNPTIKNRFDGLGSAFLLEDDINGIRSLYGSGSGSVNPLDSSSSVPTPTPSGFDGTSGNDILVGDDLANVIKGFAGDDYLEGGRGDDNLEGGSGADTFAFSSLDGSVDTILDFSSAEGDLLEVSLAGFGTGSGFSYSSNSGALFFGNEEFAILDNKPSFSDVAAGFVAS